MKEFFAKQTNRTFAVLCVFIALTVWFSAYLFYYGAVFHGFNERGDELKESYAKREERARTIEGSIIDANEETITRAEEPGVAATCCYPAYGQLVGYNSTVYGLSGLRARYADVLFTGDKHHNGSTIKLTTVNRVQNAAYEEIRGTNGCVVVLENATGRIVALATTDAKVEMDVNDMSHYQEWLAQSNSFLLQNWRAALAPGSVLKPLTATLLYEEGLADTVYQDSGSEKIAGYTFRNAGKAANGSITLNRAIVTSCNTYFSHMTDQVGSFKFQERLEAFSIGKTLELDFYSMTSYHHLSESTRVETAAAGFGQGKLALTPINIAMIGQTIANGGQSLKPYLIDSISNAGGVSYSGQTELLGQACTEEAAAYVSEAMLDAAASYGIDRERGIHAKTGTAQLGNSYRASFLSFNDKYTVCIVENYTAKAGKQLAQSAVRLYDILDERS